nr:uncharacterized protein LOC112289013 isoform X2 [Physcomitrium patens]|eukprot:XP_024389647.1 uncharacterized protein LOC112289013 isoform X2 [Physcomitrella patens]
MLDIELTTVPKAKSKNGRKTFKPSKLEEKVVVGETDMPQELQSHALRAATEALDIHEGTDYKDVAYYIKNVNFWQPWRNLTRRMVQGGNV